MEIDTHKMKGKLELELAELTAELKTLGIHNPSVKEDWIATPETQESGDADPNVVADRVEDWEERRGTLATLEKRYNNVVRALGKIKTGTYGICEISGAQIEADRLEANPSARTSKTHMDEESQLP